MIEVPPKLSRQFDVAVIGNAGIDTNIYLPGENIDFSHEANFTENIDYVGQAGGYTARGFSQLNHSTGFIGYIGEDFQGKFILDRFRMDHINTEGIMMDPAGTSRSVNFMYRDGRRKNFYDGKSHMTLKPDTDRCLELISQSRLAHFHLANWSRHLLKPVRDAGLTLSCDLQDIRDMGDEYRKEFIHYSHILFFSSVNLPDPENLMKSILKIYPDKILICGMGQQGCAAASGDSVDYYPAVNLPGPVVDTNGAGDGLAVGFLSSFLLNDYNLPDSVLRGQIAAGYTCRNKADTDHLITRTRLEKSFNRIKQKQSPPIITLNKL